MTTKESPWSVEETVSRLEGVLESRGIKLFALIDHSGEAEAVGLELRDTKVVIFGNPLAGTPVMGPHRSRRSTYRSRSSSGPTATNRSPATPNRPSWPNGTGSAKSSQAGSPRSTPSPTR